jgi:hypothetical protein
MVIRVGMIIVEFGGVMVLKKKNKKEKSRLDDVIKAMRRGNREGQQEVLGPGFHSSHAVHVSKKTYTRKTKHKQEW